MTTKQTEATAMKSNSAGASIKLGYGLYASTFSNTFRATWLPALIFSIIFAALGTITIIKLPPLMVAITANGGPTQTLAKEYLALLGTAALLVVIGGVVETAFYSCGLSLLRGHKTTGKMATAKWCPALDKHTTWRTFKAVLSVLLINAVPFAAFTLWYALKLRHILAQPGSHYAAVGITALLAIFMWLALLPTLFVAMKYVINDDKRFWPLLRTDYLPAMRHLGFMLMVVISCGAMVVMATYVLQQPAVILAVANTQANIGVANGDPLGMPTYMTALTFAIFLVSGFVQAYIRMSALFPIYYMYGSIDTQESESKKYRDDIMVGSANAPTNEQ